MEANNVSAEKGNALKQLAEAKFLEAKATSFFKKANWSKAISLYSASLGFAESSISTEIRLLRSKIFHNRSVCYSKMQQNEKALDDATNSLLCRPNSKKALFRLATVREDLHDYVAAITALKSLAKLLDIKRRKEVEQRMARLQTLEDAQAKEADTQTLSTGDEPKSNLSQVEQVTKQPSGNLQDNDSISEAFASLDREGCTAYTKPIDIGFVEEGLEDNWQLWDGGKCGGQPIFLVSIKVI